MPSPKTQAPETSADPAASLVHAIQQLSVRHTTADSLTRDAFRTICERQGSPFGLLQFDMTTGNIEDDYVGHPQGATAWRKHCDGMLLNARYRNLACGKLFLAEAAQHTFAVIAAPLSSTSHDAYGSAAIVLRCDNKTELQALVNEFHAMLSLVAIQAKLLDRPQSHSTAASSSAQSGSQSVAKAAEYQTLHEFAFAIANNLKGKLGCEQVVLGRVRGNRVQILCLSGLDELYPRSPGVKTIEQALDECLDAEQIVCFQQDAKYSAQPVSTAHQLHRTWHAETGNCPVASIPLRAAESVAAIVGLRNPADKPFSAEQLQKVAELVTPLVPALALLERAERSLGRHVLETLRQIRYTVWSTGSRFRKGMVVAATLLAIWIIVGKQHYSVSVPCAVKASRVHQIASPFDGTLASVHVRAGDRVHKSQRLVTLDTTHLQAQRAQEVAALRLAELELAQAVSAGNHAGAAQAQARVQVARSQIDTIDYALSRSQLHAPFDGVVLEGDLDHRVGESLPLGTPLVTLAPLDAFELQLHIPEHHSPYVAKGMAGTFATFAKPDEVHACEIMALASSTTTLDQRNVIAARGAFAADESHQLKHGMQGIARIDTGRHPIWWVWLHGIIDTVRIQVWKL